MWAIFNSKAYNISAHIKEHLEFLEGYKRICGKDATHIFNSYMPNVKPEIYFIRNYVGTIINPKSI